MFLEGHILRTGGDALHGSRFQFSKQEKVILSRQKAYAKLYFLAQWLNVTLSSQISGCNGLKKGPSPIHREKGRLHFSRSAFLCAWELVVPSLQNGLKNGPSPI
jgi:hypothetical protein